MYGSAALVGSTTDPHLTPIGGAMARPILTLAERFMQYVSPEPNSGCWLWLEGIAEGYGRFHLPDPRRKVQAHRLIYELTFDSIPCGFEIRHKCDNRACVNPDHMEVGTKQDNRADMARRNRGVRSRLGMPFGVREDRSRDRLAYCATFKRRGVTVQLGRFSSMEEAATVAAEAKRSYYAAEGVKK